jgi:phenylalanyl-tRNA synthetase beta chain
MAMPPQPEGLLPLSRLRRGLIAHGYQEVVTYSFVEPELQDALDPEVSTVALANPLSAELSVMRTCMWPGLVQALRYNLNRQQERVRLFETGLVFRPDADGGISQRGQIGGVMIGEVWPQQWASASRSGDFFDLKGSVERLLAIGGRQADYRFEAAQHPALHPGQTARVYDGERAIGWLGTLHPALEKRLALPAGVMLFELELEALQQAATPAFRPLSRFPGRRRDLALLVARDTPADQVMRCMRDSVGELLVELTLFDVYIGEGVDADAKSLALGLTLQAADRTLEDVEVESIMAVLMERLQRDTGATLRD